MPKCITYMLRNGSWLSRLWTKQLSRVNMKIQGNINYSVTHFLKSSENEPAIQIPQRTKS